MKNETETVSTPKELRDELKALLNEARTMMSDTLSDPPGDTLDDLPAGASTTLERLADAFAGARNKVVAGARYTNTTIRGSPYQSLALALGVGALAGALASVLVGRRNK